jgi:hypothetical protein
MSSYLAENTLYLIYKQLSNDDVQENNRYLF